MLRERSYLAEATFNIDRDVELVYKEMLKKSNIVDWYKAFQAGDKKKMIDIRRNFRVLNMDSSKLVSRISKRAHKLNPITISIGALTGGTHYSPDKKEIQVGPTALGPLANRYYNMATLRKDAGDSAMKVLSKENTLSWAKGAIAHELAHWIDDTLHNRHLKKLLDRAWDTDDPNEVIKSGASSIGRSYQEMQAHVHEAKVLRKTLGKRAYDKLTWSDFLREQALGFIFEKMKGEDDYKTFMKSFVKRLHREKLLGKAMRNIPSYEQMKRIAR